MKVKEFRSVAEAAPALLDALAKGGNVARDSLKKMSQDGLLTTKFVAEALQNTLVDLTTATANIPVTVGQAFQNTKTGFAFFVNELNKTYGITNSFSELLQEVTKVFITLGDALVSGEFKEFTNNLGIAVSVTAGLATSLYILSSAQNAANFSLLSYAKNLKIVTALQAAFNLVVSANPYVLAVAAIVGIVTALYSMRNSLVDVMGVSASVGSLIASTFDALKERVGGAINFITDSYKKVYNTLADVFSNLFNFLSDTIAGKLLRKLVDAFTNTIKALVSVGARFAKAIGLDDLSKSFNDFVSDLGQDIVLGAVVRDSKLGRPDAVNPFANNGSGVPSPDPKAAKELDDKRKQMREFSAQYALQIADQKEINRLVAEGKTIEDARYKVELDRQLIDAQKSGATTNQVAEMRVALEIAKQQVEAAKQYEEALKLIQEVEKEVGQDRAKAQEDAKKALEDFLKPEDFKVGDLFGDASKSAGALINAFQAITEQQELYNKAVEKNKDSKEELAKIEKKSAQNEIRNIGNILGATKGFFKEKSKGYKVLEIAEKGFRALEMALALESFIQKTFFDTAIATNKVATDAIVTTSDTVTTGVIVGNNAAKTSTGAITAVVNAIKDLPFPLNIAAGAATIAFLGSIGAGLAGGGGGASIPRASSGKGQGTTLGDSMQGSESLTKGFDSLESLQIEGLSISSQMLQVLRSINNGVNGFAAQVFQFKELTGKRVQGFKIPSFSLSNLSALNPSLVSQNGAFNSTRLKQAATGISGATSGALDFDFQAAQDFTDFFVGSVSQVADVFSKSAPLLGKNTAAIQNALNQVVIEKIDIKGLSKLKGEELTERLSNIVGAVGDTIAQQLNDSLGLGLTPFQQVGEGLLNTLVRVTSGVESATEQLNRLGIEAIDYTEIILKQGDVGAEIARQSIAAQEPLIGIKNIINAISGEASDIVDVYEALLGIKDSLISFGQAVTAVTSDLIFGAGGLDRLQEGVDSYFSDFLTDQEQAAELTRKLSVQFSKLGLSLPTSIDGFKQLVKGIDTSTASGQQLLGSVLALAPAFSEMSDAAEDAGSSLNDAARSIYETIRDARLESLVPTQQLDVLLSEYQSAVNLATQSTGQNLADNAGTVNGLIQPLLDSIKSVFASGPEAQRLIDSVLGQAKNVADKAAAEAFTYQDESLRLLQAQVNELQAIRSALSVGVFTPINVGANNVVPFVAPPSSSVNVNVQNGTDNSGIILALTESNAHAAALVRLQQAANQQIIEKLTEMEERLDGLESSANLAASA